MSGTTEDVASGAFADPRTTPDAAPTTTEPAGVIGDHPVGTFAHIEVWYDPDVVAYPIVERVPGGWQSGVHHYPDAAVRDVKPLNHAAYVDRSQGGVTRG